MNEFVFLRPESLWALAALAAAYLVWRLFRRRRFVAFTGVGLVRRLPHHRPSPLRRLPALLGLAASALVLIALMEPVLPYSESTIEAQGLDIVLVVDMSTSMGEIMGLYTEGAPTTRSDEGGKPFASRLEVSKRALRHFIERRKGDRVGLVVFSDNAYVISPLTFDHDYLLHYVDDIDDTLMKTEGMTAIGEGMYLGAVLFAKQSEAGARNRVMVVLTDGEHNIGRDPLQALDVLAADGVRTYLIGVDLEESIKRKPAVVELINSVRRLGGRYFQANSARQMEAANTALGALEKGRLAGKQFVRNVPVFHWFALPAIVLVLATLGLRALPYFADLA